MEHALEDDTVPTYSNESNCRNSFSSAAADSGYNQSNGFECNICLEQVQDPVVTLCGHLYCWPCIYKWLEPPGISSQNMEQPQQCPVCKSEISYTSLIPLYGRGQATRNLKSKGRQLGIAVLRRPLSPSVHPDTPRSVPRVFTSRLSPGLGLNSQGYQSNSQSYISHLGHFPTPALLGNTAMSIINPIVGILGEMVQAGFFGNLVADLHAYPNADHPEDSIPRARRHVMQMNRSLTRICLLLLCCCILCLLLF